MARKTYSFDLYALDVKVTSFPIYMRGYKASVQDYESARNLAFSYARTLSKTYGAISLCFDDMALDVFEHGVLRHTYPSNCLEVERRLCANL